MKPWVIVMLCIIAVLIIAMVALYFFGKKQEKKQAEAQEQMKAVAQSVSLLVIDKKRMKIMTLMCDEKIFPLIPIKKEVKAVISGIYITEVRGIRGPLETKEEKKKGLFRRK